MKVLASIAAVAGLALGSAWLAPCANADEINWVGPVEGNASEDLSSQLGLEVVVDPSDSTKVLFKFTNDVGTSSSVMEIYFEQALEDWIDLDTMAIDSQTGGTTTPDFDAGSADPGGPPGLSGFTVGNMNLAAADAGEGGPTKGINESGDEVVISFDFADDATLAGLVAALNSATQSDALLAVHVTSIGSSENSDTYFTGIETPEPTSIVLLGSALMGLVFVEKRRRRADAS